VYREFFENIVAKVFVVFLHVLRFESVRALRVSAE